jgi:23S rRNA (adenine-N6)-dimethyltransferase
VADAAIRPGDLVLDVGAGHGALTRHLVAAGARVLAIELHPGRADRLRDRFAADAVTVVRADARELRLPRRPFRVVASPPYGIASALLRTLLVPRSQLITADLVLQRAVVRRWVRTGARRWQLSAGRPLPRRAFRPPPKVDSAVLLVRRR